MAIICTDLAGATEQTCLDGRGQTVILATMAQMVCNFNDALAAGTAFTCDVNVLSSQVTCLAARGETFVTGILAQELCQLLTTLAAGLSNCGVVDPIGVVTGLFCGMKYFNTVSDTTWTFKGTVGTNTGWV